MLDRLLNRNKRFAELTTEFEYLQHRNTQGDLNVFNTKRDKNGS